MGGDSRRVRLGSLPVGCVLGRICNSPGGKGRGRQGTRRRGRGEEEEDGGMLWRKCIAHIFHERTINAIRHKTRKEGERRAQRDDMTDGFASTVDHLPPSGTALPLLSNYHTDEVTRWILLYTITYTPVVYPIIEHVAVGHGTLHPPTHTGRRRCGRPY